MTFAEAIEKLKLRQVRSEQRREKGIALGLRKPEDDRQPISILRKSRKVTSKKSPRQNISDAICRNLGLLDSLKNGPMCRICGKAPGVLGYHIIPQVSGYAVRFEPDNVVWACVSCNGREYYMRLRGRGHEMHELHKEIFGAERVDDLWRRSRETSNKFKTRDLLEILTRVRTAVIENGGEPA